MPNINDNPYIKELIYKWNERFRRAGVNQKTVCREVDISESHLSQILNMKVDNPRQSTINKIEMYLNNKGV